MHDWMRAILLITAAGLVTACAPDRLIVDKDWMPRRITANIAQVVTQVKRNVPGVDVCVIDDGSTRDLVVQEHRDCLGNAHVGLQLDELDVHQLSDCGQPAHGRARILLPVRFVTMKPRYRRPAPTYK